MNLAPFVTFAAAAAKFWQLKTKTATQRRNNSFPVSLFKEGHRKQQERVRERGFPANRTQTLHTRNMTLFSENRVPSFGLCLNSLPPGCGLNQSITHARGTTPVFFVVPPLSGEGRCRGVEAVSGGAGAVAAHHRITERFPCRQSFSLGREG